MNKNYTNEIKVIKGLFCFTLISHISIYYILPYLNYDICNWSITDGWWCNFSLYQNMYFFSWYMTLLAQVYLVSSKKFMTWLKVVVVFILLQAANLFLREDINNDFFMMGPGPTAIYIYTIGFVWSLFIIFKNRE